MFNKHGVYSVVHSSNCYVSSPVCEESRSMCEVLTNLQSSPIDLSPELTRAVTNVVCALCFNSSYKRGDPEFEAMLKYSQGIVDTVAKDSLVDIFPWLQVKCYCCLFIYRIIMMSFALS